MIRRPPRSTLDRSSAASDVYKRQLQGLHLLAGLKPHRLTDRPWDDHLELRRDGDDGPVSYTHLRAHETVLDLVCRLLLEKKKKKNRYRQYCMIVITTITDILDSCPRDEPHKSY